MERTSAEALPMNLQDPVSTAGVYQEAQMQSAAGRRGRRVLHTRVLRQPQPRSSPLATVLLYLPPLLTHYIPLFLPLSL